MNTISIPSNFSVQNGQCLNVELPEKPSVLIIGNIASGKSTFANEFSNLNNLEIIELDTLRDCENADIGSNKTAKNHFLEFIGKPQHVCVYVGIGLGERGEIANLRADLIIRIHATERTCLERIKKRTSVPPAYVPMIDFKLLKDTSETLNRRGYSLESMNINGIPLIHFSSEGL
jgi:dephospho-CoA kinase